MSNAPRTALILGGRTGLVGRPLTAALAAAGWTVFPVGREDFDPTDRAASSGALDEIAPTHVFNAVAYAKVDQAESEPAEAARLNAELPALWAELCAGRGNLFTHISTDFVFSGDPPDGPGTPPRPYREEDPAGPASVYGRTKLDGETAVRSILPDGGLIVRTAWLFGPGKMNFVRRILELARKREELRIVADQQGSPTYVPDLARHLVRLVETGATGVYHVVNSGSASWQELAAEAVRLAGLSCRVTPIATAEYPLPARRPAWSVLDPGAFVARTGETPRDWRAALADYVLRVLPGETVG